LVSINKSLCATQKDFFYRGNAMKWLAIINPLSGKNKNQTKRQHLLLQLRSLVDAYEITRCAGHARELAHTASDFDGIAVAGGDGTLFEILNGMELLRQHLTIIPAGTGNSLSRDLALHTIDQGIEALQAGFSLCIDLMRVSFTTRDGSMHRCFAATTIGLGYPANVTQIGNQRFKHLGRWCYPVAATVETVSSKPFSMHIGYRGNHAEWKELTGLLINNTQHSGNFRAFPCARLDDGLFDVMEMNAGWSGQNMHNLSVLSRTYFYRPAKLTQTSSVSITLKQPHHLMIDGELFPHVTSLDVRIAPQILTCHHNGRLHR
jgi:diacylglycerol kinase (ATP)